MLEALVAAMLAAFMSPTGAIEEAPFIVWIVDDEALVSSGAARRTMHDEVNQIWNPYGIRIEWALHFPTESSAPGMIVVLRASPDPLAPLGSVQLVGHTIRRHIAVSTSALDLFMTRSGIRTSDPRWEKLRARTLGRVVGHELGHVLLNSPDHTESGLMRKSFGIADIFASDDRFTLTIDQLTSLLYRHEAATPVSRAVRCSDARLCVLLADGRAESPTLDALLNRVVGLKGLVYIAWTPTLASTFEAALLHRIQLTPDGTTCLWIVLHRRNHLSRALLPILGHELEHAIEVLESRATSSADVEGVFSRIAATHGHAKDTEPAQHVQAQVASELRDR